MIDLRDTVLPHGTLWAFVGLQYYGWLWNRVYALCVGPSQLVGVVGTEGAVGPPRTTTRAARQAILQRMAVPGQWLSEQVLMPYFALAIDDPATLRMAKANFCLPLADIRWVDHRDGTEPDLGPLPSSGRIVIGTDARTLEFVLLGQEDGRAVRRKLATAAGVV